MTAIEKTEATTEAENTVDELDFGEEPKLSIEPKEAKMDNQSFTKVLTKFVKDLRSTKRTAHQLACAAAAHFVEYGDTCRLEQLLKVFEGAGKNFVRVAAFKEWMRVHLPIAMDLDTKRLIKDPSRDFSDELIEAAYSKPFWEFVPDKEVMEWDIDDLKKALNRVIAKYQDSKYLQPANAEAKAELAKAARLVNAL